MILQLKWNRIWNLISKSCLHSIHEVNCTANKNTRAPSIEAWTYAPLSLSHSHFVCLSNVFSFFFHIPMFCISLINTWTKIFFFSFFWNLLFFLRCLSLDHRETSIRFTAPFYFRAILTSFLCWKWYADNQIELLLTNHSIIDMGHTQHTNRLWCCCCCCLFLSFLSPNSENTIDNHIFFF